MSSFNRVFSSGVGCTGALYAECAALSSTRYARKQSKKKFTRERLSFFNRCSCCIPSVKSQAIREGDVSLT
jgi:hypothetical protein